MTGMARSVACATLPNTRLAPCNRKSPAICRYEKFVVPEVAVFRSGLEASQAVDVPPILDEFDKGGHAEGKGSA